MLDIPALLHNIYTNTIYCYSGSQTLHTVPELGQCQAPIIDSLKEIKYSEKRKEKMNDGNKSHLCNAL